MKLWKIWIFASLVLFSSLYVSTVVKADIPTYVMIDGQQQDYEQAPVIINDRTLVPMRAIFESLWATVNWDQDTQTVTATKGNTTISLQIGSKTAYKNGIAVQLDVPAQLINDHTMVPIRFIVETLGYNVEWIPGNNYNKVSITTVSDHDLTTEEIGRYSDRVVLIETFDNSGNLLGSGSGFVVYVDMPAVLTNYHVIAGASSARVTFPDGKTYTTDLVINADKSKDLVLIDDPKYFNIPIINIGDSSKIRLGQQVVAIGSPLGLQNTLSTGVVSTVSRTVGGKEYIQISAPIDHGSSGGALFNMRGELIGVTSAGFVSAADLNLAIPSTVVKQFLKELETPVKMSQLK